MSKPDWVKEHIEEYRKNPEKGHMWDSSVVGGPGEVPCLLLTTTGRKSGKERTTPLIYSFQDGGYVIIASKGGAPDHPSWFLNIQDNPEVTIQVSTHEMKARAEVVDGEKRERLWEAMVKVWPDYENYQKKTDRKIPVVLLLPK
jgi:deazaflavin-dependent oxidoreductase (nitroreductase family)